MKETMRYVNVGYNYYLNLLRKKTIEKNDFFVLKSIITIENKLSIKRITPFGK